MGCEIDRDIDCVVLLLGFCRKALAFLIPTPISNIACVISALPCIVLVRQGLSVCLPAFEYQSDWAGENHEYNPFCIYVELPCAV